MRRFFSFFFKKIRERFLSPYTTYDSQEMGASSSSSSSLTEAEIDKLTASKLRKLLDAKEIAYEKKELKAALAAKLKDAMRKEKEGKEEEEEEEEEEEDSDEEDFDEYEDDGSVEWMLRMHQKIARPKNKRDWEIRESVLSGGGIP